MYAVLCDSTGKHQLGSDSVINVDGRFSRENQIESVRKYKERFKKNFLWKYELWTHVYFVGSINNMPDSYNKRSMPRLYKL